MELARRDPNSRRTSGGRYSVEQSSSPSLLHHNDPIGNPEASFIPPQARTKRRATAPYTGSPYHRHTTYGETTPARRGPNSG
ncbi:Os05g0213200 [Oryza sativa Japonica Group]|uniref:Os05g0213200 protein n=2 Tax=Oryza sativa subsp. japonica TaxID=39947 RepID=B9FN39_ORYSJ|nr:hypothetical protein OsJ_17547 [Oryza sativa Japonica Group]BAS92814.1 Os05g0213200 [Oryza sativa Japonica Group]